MKIALVGGSYTERSLPFDAQRSINLYPVFDEQGKEVSALYGTPGLTLFSTCGTGPGRGMFTAANGRCFVVANSGLYELTSAGVSTSLGTLSSTSGAVTMAENGTQLAICDGTRLYTLTYSTNTFAQVTDPDLPTAVGTVTCIDGYFVVNSVGTGKFYISALNDGTSWAALDFATAESSPDDLQRVINAVGQLWLFGSQTTEIWTNTGASSFPFERISGAKLEVGILSPYSAAVADGSVFFVGKDDKGAGIVYRTDGFSPKRVSTNAIEYAIGQATSATTMRGYCYQQDGHLFYVLTGGGLATTLVYDISTQLWHERAYLNTFGAYELHLGETGTYAFSKQLVVSRLNGKVYELSLSTYSDDGAALSSERIFQHISKEDDRLVFKQLEIALEAGVGLSTGQGSDPQIQLSISRDGAKTWSTTYTTTIGALGKYGTRAVFRRLGMAKNLTFKVRITDPVKRALIGGYLE